MLEWTSGGCGVSDYKTNSSRSSKPILSLVLALSLEKRSIPRCNVLEVLYLNGLTGKLNAGSVTSALKLNEKMFLEKFVMKYQDAVPKMVIAYKSKIGLAELEEKDGLQEMQKG
ncbi:hypothetical protein IFM89_007530 [Coptis chinensis]|uniref:Uncharacterized protein n=1 Tax=Coptis chinensis TaxID=261450 RepID=A0A835HZY6_9MAGN|nr:hypothetical protein IFM89_007530 [Coptis chinensis]